MLCSTLSQVLILLLASPIFTTPTLSENELDSEITSSNSIANIRNIISEQNSILWTASNMVSNYLAQFQACFRKINNNNGQAHAEYLFSVEGENLIFNCGPCAPPSRRMYWRLITFEGKDCSLPNLNMSRRDTEEECSFESLNYFQNEYQELVLISQKPVLSTFYCYWEDTNLLDGSKTRVTSKILTVEIVGVAHMAKSSVKSWQKNKYSSEMVKMSKELVIGDMELRVGTRWTKWSTCSQCDGLAGKRYKAGYCSIEEMREVTPESGSGEVLRLHKLPVSCSLLIDFHPEILSEIREFSEVNRLNHVLGRSPMMLVGYCRNRKRTCENENFSRNRVISQVYQDFEMKGERYRSDDEKDDGEAGASWSVIWLMKSLVNGIPFGWNNLPEIVALVGLIILQSYVIYLILKWKNEAN